MQDFIIPVVVGPFVGWRAYLVVPNTTGLRYIVPGIGGAFYGVVVFSNISLPAGETLIFELALAAGWCDRFDWHHSIFLCAAQAKDAREDK